MAKKQVKAHSREGKKVRAHTRNIPDAHAKISRAIEKLQGDRETEYEKVRKLRAPYEEAAQNADSYQKLGLPAPPRKEMSSKTKSKIAECEAKADFHGQVINKLHEKKRNVMEKAAEKAANSVLRSSSGKSRNNSITSAGTGYIDTNTNYIQSNA